MLFAAGIGATGILALSISHTFGPGEVLDSSVMNAAFKEITDSLDYNSTETATKAKWIDGKTIYRKVIDVGSLPNTTGKAVAHGISSIDTLVSVSGSANQPGFAHYPLPYVHPTTAQLIQVYVDATNVQIGTGQDWSAWTGKIVIEYTK